jgi:SAM-dependent methyltransferase
MGDPRDFLYVNKNYVPTRRSSGGVLSWRGDHVLFSCADSPGPAIRRWGTRDRKVRRVMKPPPNLNEYVTAEHALKYLALADRIPHRAEGEGVLLDFIPKTAKRILDLGTGDGRLLALARLDRPSAKGVAIDFSPTMLSAARERFRGDESVQVIEHNLDEPLPDLGAFDVIVSSFAIHHCTDQRKRALYSEIHASLEQGGVFCNLEQGVTGV